MRYDHGASFNFTYNGEPSDQALRRIYQFASFRELPQDVHDKLSQQLARDLFNGERRELVIRVYKNGSYEIFQSDNRGNTLHEKTLRSEPDSRERRTTAKPRPPVNIEIILHLLLPPQKADAVAGDLEELYRKKFERLGKCGADLWYLKQVTITIWPIVRATRRACIVNVICFVLRFLGLGNIADQLKDVTKTRRPGS